jgi:hypothetical protein
MIPYLQQTVAYVKSRVLESFGNPNIHPSQTFWQLVNQGGLQRPMIRSDGYTLLSLELQIVADVALYLRDREKYLYLIRCTYELLITDYPVLVAIVGRVTRNASRYEITLHGHRVSMKYLLGFGMLLALRCTLNRILRKYDREVTQLVTTYHLFCDNTIALAESLETYQPSTSVFIPVLPICAWASSTDGYRVSEITKAIMS